MTTKTRALRLLVAVGSRHDRICSVGAFARAEAHALEAAFKSVEILEPDEHGVYPLCQSVARPDVIFFHAPSLHDRGKPWRALLSAALLRKAFPNAVFIPIVHELSEAPLHWRVRQNAILMMGHGVIANSEPDYQGARRWSRRILRANLGPTLFYTELVERGADLPRMRAEARAALVRQFGASAGLSEGEKWLLHPGLVTPGKGVNFLGKLAAHLDPDVRLVVMGGLGPKAKDREFASGVLSELRRDMSGRFSFIEGPDDDVYRKFLLASDLVVLPYDVGVSERRSSLLSAMSCGANVWTTTGIFSSPLKLERTGVHTIPVERWRSGDPGSLRTVADALAESPEMTLERRLKNLAWAAERTWNKRLELVGDFISSLVR